MAPLLSVLQPSSSAVNPKVTFAEIFNRNVTPPQTARPPVKRVESKPKLPLLVLNLGHHQCEYCERYFHQESHLKSHLVSSKICSDIAFANGVIKKCNRCGQYECKRHEQFDDFGYDGEVGALDPVEFYDTSEDFGKKKVFRKKYGKENSPRPKTCEFCCAIFKCSKSLKSHLRSVVCVK